jgi:hypothetical protein
MIQKLNLSTKNDESSFTLGFLEMNNVITIANEKIWPAKTSITRIETFSPNPLYTDMTVADLSDLVNISKLNQYSSFVCKGDEKTEFEALKVGEFSFKLDICQSRSDKYFYINMNSTFNVKDDILKIIIESIDGVESYNAFNYNKYETRIRIGKLFDPYAVRKNVEIKLQEFLTD